MPQWLPYKADRTIDEVINMYHISKVYYKLWSKKSMALQHRSLSNNNTIWIQLMDNDGNWHWYHQNYTLPKPRKLEVLEEFDISKKNPDLDNTDDDEEIDNEDNIDIDEIDDCIHCKIDNGSNDPSGDGQRSVNAEDKLSILWARIKLWR